MRLILALGLALSLCASMTHAQNNLEDSDEQEANSISTFIKSYNIFRKTCRHQEDEDLRDGGKCDNQGLQQQADILLTQGYCWSTKTWKRCDTKTRAGLIKAWAGANDGCRGASDQLDSCVVRSLIDWDLYKRFNYCYGTEDQAGFQYTWHRCGPKSYKPSNPYKD